MTKSGQSELERPIAIRPTSETVMYPYYAQACPTEAIFTSLFWSCLPLSCCRTLESSHRCWTCAGSNPQQG